MRAGAGGRISSEASRQRVHELRGVCDGVLVGIGTVLADDPLLTSRDPDGRQPARVVLDDKLRLRPESQLVRTINQSPVLLATTAAGLEAGKDRAEALKALGVELLVLPPGPGGVDVAALLDELGRREWTRLLIEGGSAVLGSVLRSGLADEVLVFIAPRIVGAGESVPCVTWPPGPTAGPLDLPAPQVEVVGEDLLLKFRLAR